MRGYLNTDLGGTELPVSSIQGGLQSSVEHLAPTMSPHLLRLSGVVRVLVQALTPPDHQVPGDLVKKGFPGDILLLLVQVGQELTPTGNSLGCFYSFLLHALGISKILLWQHYDNIYDAYLLCFLQPFHQSGVNMNSFHQILGIFLNFKYSYYLVV